MAFDNYTTPDPELTRDPIQGFDVEVYSVSQNGDVGVGLDSDAQLQGTFTSLMFKVVNQTETYLPLNSRLPRHLDGEFIFVWAAEQGLVTSNFMVNSFGKAFADAVNTGRGYKVPRMERFRLIFAINTGEDTQDISRFNNDNFPAQLGGLKYFMLDNCRVDTYSFGVTAGRHVVANSWQGTAEGLKESGAGIGPVGI